MRLFSSKIWYLKIQYGSGPSFEEVHLNKIGVYRSIASNFTIFNVELLHHVYNMSGLFCVANEIYIFIWTCLIFLTQFLCLWCLLEKCLLVFNVVICVFQQNSLQIIIITARKYRAKDAQLSIVEVIIHGEQDETIPASHGRQCLNACDQSRAKGPNS